VLANIIWSKRYVRVTNNVPSDFFNFLAKQRLSTNSQSAGTWAEQRSNSCITKGTSNFFALWATHRTGLPGAWRLWTYASNIGSKSPNLWWSNLKTRMGKQNIESTVNEQKTHLIKNFITMALNLLLHRESANNLF